MRGRLPLRAPSSVLETLLTTGISCPNIQQKLYTKFLYPKLKSMIFHIQCPLKIENKQIFGKHIQCQTAHGKIQLFQTHTEHLQAQSPTNSKAPDLYLTPCRLNCNHPQTLVIIYIFPVHIVLLQQSMLPLSTHHGPWPISWIRIEQSLISQTYNRKMNSLNFEKLSRLDLTELDEETIAEIKETSGRVSNFTFNYFFLWLWGCTLIFILALSFFTVCYRRMRGDQETFLQKLGYKAKGRKQILQQREQYEKYLTDPNRKTINERDGTVVSAKEWREQDDEQAKAWLGINSNIKSFFGLLQLIDEDTMIRFMGRDLTIFLKFLDYQTWMFLAILIMQWTVLMPLYYTGEDADKYLLEVIEKEGGKAVANDTDVDSLRFMQQAESSKNITIPETDREYNMIKFTILNIQSNPTRMTFAFLMVIFTTLVVYLQIFCFWKRTFNWKEKDFVRGEDAQFGDFHKYSILIRGIPRNLDPNDASENIKRILNKQHDIQGKIIDVKVVGDYRIQYSMGKKWDALQEQRLISEEYERLLQDCEEFEDKTPDEKAEFLQELDADEKMQKNSFNIPQREDEEPQPEKSCIWRCWQFLCCERQIAEDDLLPSERFLKSVRQAHGVRNRCCWRIKLDEQKAKTRKLKEQSDKIMRDMEKAIKSHKPTNIGCGFILTTDKSLVKKIVNSSRPIFEHESREQISFFEATKYQVENWEQSESFHEDDIRWDELNRDPVWQFKKYVAIILLLFILSVVLITPLQVYKGIQPVTDTVRAWGTGWVLLTENSSPLIIALVNIGIIPMIVDICALIITNETKSQMQYEILKMNLVFMMLNMILLPMTGLVTYEELLTFARDSDFKIEKLLNKISLNMGNMASWFAVYLMQVTFLSNMIQLFDVPHLLYKSGMRLIAYIRQKHFIDDYYFQLGYYQSYTCTIMTMSLMFSVTMPIVNIFAVIFFAMRYYIEKYNFLFVYQQEYESGGNTRSYLIPYQIISVLLFQAINYTFISSLTDNELMISSWFGYGFIIFQVIVILGCNCLFKKSKSFKYMMKKLLFLQNNKDASDHDGSDLLFRKLKTTRRTAREVMNAEAIIALRSSYEHPWHKIQRKIEFIQDKQGLRNYLIDGQPQGLQGRKSGSRLHETECLRNNSFHDISQGVMSKQVLDIPDHLRGKSSHRKRPLPDVMVNNIQGKREHEIIEVMNVSQATLEKSREQGIQRTAVNVNVSKRVNINGSVLGESQRSEVQQKPDIS